MSLVRSLIAGKSSLRAHQQRLDVISNNIANVNTTGYKASRVSFVEQFSQTFNAGHAPNGLTFGGMGGVNPSQIGLGVRAGEITQDVSQGAIQITGRPLDVALEGEGYFMLQRNGQDYYSRNGAFTFDRDGNLVDGSSGSYVQGYNLEVDLNGRFVRDVVTGNNKLDRKINNIRIDPSIKSAPRQTTSMGFEGNLDARSRIGEVMNPAITVFNQQGGTHSVSLRFTPIERLDGTRPTGDKFQNVYVMEAYVDFREDRLNAPLTFGLPQGYEYGDPTLTSDERSAPAQQLAARTTRLIARFQDDGTLEGLYNLPDDELIRVSAQDRSDARMPGVTVNSTATNGTSTYRIDVPAGTDANDRLVSILSPDRRYDPPSSKPNSPIAFDFLSGMDPRIIPGQPAPGDVSELRGGGAGNAFNGLNEALGVRAFDNDPGTLTDANGAPTGDQNPVKDITVSLAERLNRIAGITQFATQTTIAPTGQNGYRDGELNTLDVDESGKIVGSFTNGQSELLGQIAVAQFRNPAGLLRRGGSLYQTSPNSGPVEVGTAKESYPSTAFASRSLEGSNVELTEQFTELISTQRAFEAASRTVTISDQFLAEINQLKR